MSELVDKTILVKALTLIARGREDNGRALGGQNAQGIARDALFAIGLDWPHDVLRPTPSNEGQKA